MIWPFRRKPQIEQRASASGFTAEIIAARESYLSGSRGVAELTATVQTCVGLWENGLSLADVTGTGMLTPSAMAMVARSLALRGEAVMAITGDGLLPASDWEISTRDGAPVAYRLTVPEIGGGRSRTMLAAEVLHPRIGVDVSAPWYGQAPLRRASLTAGLLHALESALCEVYELAPIGSQIVPFPESSETDLDRLGRGFRGQRGRVLLRESVSVPAAGGPLPQTDWRPADVSPDLSKAMTKESLSAAREAILGVFGVLPSMFSANAQGNATRENQRHLAQWQLQPIATLLAQEASLKLDAPVTIDVMRPLQAFDAGGRARAVSTVIKALSEAKEAGIDPNAALRLVDWESKE